MPVQLLDFMNENRGKPLKEKLEVIFQLFNQYGNYRAWAVDDDNFLVREDFVQAYGLIERKMHWILNEIEKECSINHGNQV